MQRVSKLRLHLTPGLSSVSSLGVADAEELLEAEVLAGGRSEELPAGEWLRRFRFPLPGTPDHVGGPLTGRPEGPRGAGTGWVVLERWNGSPWGALFRSRLSHPRSASQAERRWNLLCHLRQHGVGTPQPLAVGARGEGFVSRDSFLVTREVEGAVPLADWFASASSQERRRGLRAIGAALSRLIGAGVELPELSARAVLLQPPRDDSECDAEATGSLRLNRLPSVVISDVTGGRLRRETTSESVAELLTLVDDPRLAVDDGERLRIAHVALRRLERPLRREVWRRLVRASRSGERRP